MNQPRSFVHVAPLCACAVLVFAPLAVRAGESPASPAQVTFSGSLTALSQYRFRGVSRSDGQPAVQAEVLASHTSGLYAGISLSSEKPSPAVDLGHAELDVYAGYDHALGSSGLMVDLGLRGYLYPDRGQSSIVEMSATLHRQIGPLDLRGGLAWAPPQAHLGRSRQTGALRDSMYVFAQARTDVPGTPVHLHVHAGHTAGGLDYTGSYWDYRLGAGVSHKALSLDLSLVGTDVSRAAATAALRGLAGDPAATWRAVRSAGIITVSYQF